MRLRAEQGAYTGALQIENFTLPNPGGGANLIDDGEFRAGKYPHIVKFDEFQMN